VIVVSGEEDLAPAIAEVQEFGVRVLLLHIGADGSWPGSRALRQECDEVIEISPSHLRPYVDLISGAEPRLVNAGYRELPAGAAHVSGPHAVPEAAGPRLFDSPTPAGYERAAQLAAASGQAQDPRNLLTGADVRSAPAHEDHAAQPSPAHALRGEVQPGQRPQGQQQQVQPQQASAVSYHQADAGGPGYGVPGDAGGRGFGGTADAGGPGYGVSGDAGGRGFGGTADAGGPGYGVSGDAGGRGFGGTADAGGPAFGVTGDAGRPGFGTTADAGGPAFGRPADASFGQPAFGAHSANGHGGAGQPQNFAQPGVPPDGRAHGSSPLDAGVDRPGAHAQDQAGLGAHALPPAPIPGSQLGGLPGSQLGGLSGNGYGASGGHANGVPASGAPVNGVPGNGMPGNGMSGNGMMPGNGMPGNGMPHGLSSSGLAAYGVPGNGQSPSEPPPSALQPGVVSQGGPAGGQPGAGPVGPQHQLPGQPYPPAALGQAGHHLTGQPIQGQPLPGQQPEALPSSAQALPPSAQALPPSTSALPPPSAPSAGQHSARGLTDHQSSSLVPFDAQRPPLPQRQLPAGNGMPYGQDRGTPYPAQPSAPPQFGGQVSQQPYGSSPYGAPMSAPPPSAPLSSAPLPSAPPPAQLPVAEAVQAAHAEGFGFGEAVARDAPALWLEAVLARKPRMPSDLEARLLQGSALPIDSLLHDEVRHALRRGFWDALERSRH
jgi:hypothetical protein